MQKSILIAVFIFVLAIANLGYCACNATGYNDVPWGTEYINCKEKLGLGALQTEGETLFAHFNEKVELGGIPFNAGAIFTKSGKLSAVELVYIDDTNDDGHINCRNSVLMDICGDCDKLLSATMGQVKIMRWDEGKLRTRIVQDYSTPGMYSLVVTYYTV